MKVTIRHSIQNLCIKLEVRIKTFEDRLENVFMNETHFKWMCLFSRFLVSTL